MSIPTASPPAESNSKTLARSATADAIKRLQTAIHRAREMEANQADRSDEDEIWTGPIYDERNSAEKALIGIVRRWHGRDDDRPLTEPLQVASGGKLVLVIPPYMDDPAEAERVIVVDPADAIAI